MKNDTLLIKNTIICPGCGWIGEKSKLDKNKCPRCGYKNKTSPYRLLTMSEMESRKYKNEEYQNVNMYKFLKSYNKICDENIFNMML
jgi:hypothetical protein